MKKTITLMLSLAMILMIALTGCQNSGPKITQTPLPSKPPKSTPEIVIPKETPDTTPSVEPTEEPDILPEKPVVPDEPRLEALEDTYFYYNSLGISFNLPASWAGHYAYEESVDKDDYPSVYFGYYDNAEKEFIDIFAFNVDNTATLKDTYGDNFVEKMENTKLLGEYGEYSVIMSWIDAPTGDNETYNTMYNDSLDYEMELFIPVPPYIPEEAQPLVDAIVASRNDEDNMYNDVIADPENTLYFDIMNVSAEDVSAFAVSMSMMNVHAYAVAIVKPVDGKLDNVIAGLNQYVTNTQGNFENYLPDQYEISQNAIVKEVNGHAVLVMCEDATTVFDNISKNLK